MRVLVDSSVWISFFRGRDTESAVSDALDYLLAGDEAVVNDVILSELLPAMRVRNETKNADLLGYVRTLPLATDWEGIRALQETCLRHGINKVGIPDLMIAQQAIVENLPLFSLDAHFRLLAQQVPLRLWPQERQS